MRPGSFLAIHLVVFAACSADSSSRTVVIRVMAADRAEPGATVISYRNDRVGTIIEQASVDVDGRAAVLVDDETLIAVVFPSMSIMTVPAPEQELTVSGPALAVTPPAVATLTVSAPPLANATEFIVRLGCTRAYSASLPATIEIAACDLGTDDLIDVIVHGVHPVSDLANAEDGYSATRIAVVNGAASFDIAAWEMTPLEIPVSIASYPASLDASLVSDGLVLGYSSLDAGRFVIPKGLVVDATRVVATSRYSTGQRTTSRMTAGIPMALSFSEADFLPVIVPTVQLTNTNPLALQWKAETIGDAVEVFLSWETDGVGPRKLVNWRAVLPPDMARVTLPAFVGDLAVATSRAMPMPEHVSLRYIDSSAADGFDAFLAEGVGTPAENLVEGRSTYAFGWK